MGNSEIVASFIVVIWIALCTRSVVSQVDLEQIFGPGFCLLSRIDNFPCDVLLDEAATPLPNANEYGIYQTTFIPGGAGLPQCAIQVPPSGNANLPIRRIQSIGLSGQVMYLVSPGIELQNPQPYGNQQLVMYNIRCPSNHIAYFNLTESDMEGPVCLGQCVDYLTVNRGEFGSTESCGNDTSLNNEQLELGEFSAVFRTSPTNQFLGFRAKVICIELEEEPPSDCVEVGADMMPIQRGSSRRKRDLENRRRDLEQFHSQWQRRLAKLERIRRQSPEKDIKIRFEKINVGHQVNVTFKDKTLNITDLRTNNVTRIKDILFLHTFDAEGNVDEFREEAVVNEQLIPFPGPGPLFILDRHAYFQLFVIDPRGLIPNENESMIISLLTMGQFDALVLEREEDVLSREFLDPPTPDLESIGLPIRGKRRKRQTTSTDMPPPTFSDDVLRTAIEFENACSPVVRADAVATIQSANEDDVQRIRDMLSSGIGSGGL